MTEANTAAEFYHQARLIGLPVELEISTLVGRLDIVVFSRKTGNLVAIVECKRDRITVKERSRQMERYREIGLPLYWINMFSAAGKLVALIDENHGEEEGIMREWLRRMPTMNPVKTRGSKWS